MNFTQSEKLALRALRDCKVIRASCFHPAYSSLRRRGWAFTTSAANMNRATVLRDYRLSALGASSIHRVAL